MQDVINPLMWKELVYFRGLGLEPHVGSNVGLECTHEAALPRRPATGGESSRISLPLSRCTGNVDFGIVRRFTALES